MLSTKYLVVMILLLLLLLLLDSWQLQSSLKRNHYPSLGRLFNHHSEISPEVEQVRSELITLCDEYKTIESRYLPVKSYRKLREVPELRDIEERIKIKILQLSTQNPHPEPLKSWGSKAGSVLDGAWKLRFTTALDAKPELTNKRTDQVLSTSQYVNSNGSEIMNIIKFLSLPDEKPISTIRVTVEGKPLSENRLQLSFRKVNIERPNARFLKNFSFPFPRLPLSNYFVNLRNAKNPKRPIGPYFDIIYLDDDVRIHKTGRGDFFVQTRLYDVWDPMTGWKYISLL